MFGCLSVNHAETIEWILMKFGIQTGYKLTWSTGYFQSHRNVGEAPGRRYIDIKPRAFSSHSSPLFKGKTQ
uniref:SFRICE_039452 n=1 Tax=Spodoptera frugiperda TaxID=7108 RepID=A0A2H1V823_SPOFR